jgi:hypothetical protein
MFIVNLVNIILALDDKFSQEKLSATIFLAQNQAQYHIN